MSYVVGLDTGGTFTDDAYRTKKVEPLVPKTLVRGVYRADRLEGLGSLSPEYRRG